EYPPVRRSFGRNVNTRSRAGLVEFHGIGDEVLKDLSELNGVGGHGRQVIVRNGGVGFLEGWRQVLQDTSEHELSVHALERTAARADARKREQVVDQRLHALDALHREPDELVRVGIEPAVIAARQELRIAGHHAERLLEVVRSNVGELLELGVRSRKLLRRTYALRHVAEHDRIHPALPFDIEPGHRTLCRKHFTTLATAADLTALAHQPRSCRYGAEAAELIPMRAPE